MNQNNKYKDMAHQLLNISFDVHEWDKRVFEEVTREVANQIEELEKRGKTERFMFGIPISLFDLLYGAYERGCFEICE